MKINERPFITFRRTLNKGISPRKEKVDKKTGEITRPAHPGEFQEDWQKSLVDFRPPFSPYVWATAQWVTRQIANGRKPIDCGGLENLPANYPADWRAQLEEVFQIVRPQIEANKALLAAQKELEELRANAKETGSGKQGKSNRQDAGRSEESLGTAG